MLMYVTKAKISSVGSAGCRSVNNGAGLPAGLILRLRGKGTLHGKVGETISTEK